MVAQPDHFKTLENALAELGLADHARWLRQSAETPCTMSSELYGELGLALERIYRAIPTEARVRLRREFDSCVWEVRRAWPEFKLPPTNI